MRKQELLQSSNLTHVSPVTIAPPQLEQQLAQLASTTVADHEREVNELMQYSDTHAEDQRQNLAIHRERSHRKTMLRVAQRKAAQLITKS